MLTTLVYVVNRELTQARPDTYLAVAQDADSEVVAKASTRTPRIDWKLLRGLHPATGAATADLRRMDGRLVALPGYIVPLEDEAGVAGEFLLVPYFGACVHTPPPPPNQMVLVRMSAGRAVRVAMGAVWVHGVLRIDRHEGVYGPVAYQMVGSHLEPFLE
ncbi:MAG: DUF3299 domain-containing protein [Acidobacteria bacterium]|nr:DUF3299 domain-containing protein [Acidobacteriota bacterium]